MTETATWEVFDPGPSAFAESLLWDASRNSLWWIDIHARQLHCRELNETESRFWRLDDEPGALALDSKDRVIVGGRSALWRFAPDHGTFEALAPAPFEPAQMRFNDCGVDPKGRLILSSLYDPKDRPSAGLYEYRANAFRLIVDGVITGNTPAWSPAGDRLYWADTRGLRVLSFDYACESGDLGASTDLWRSDAFAPGRPDGMAMDRDGCLWVTLFEGQRLVRLDPHGTLIAEYPVPAMCPTRPVFAGPNLDYIYLATAGSARPAEEREQFPLSGSILRMPAPVPGLGVPAALID